MKKIISNILVIVGSMAIAVALGFNVPKIVNMFSNPFKTGDYSQHVAGQPNLLTLYGTTTCPHCASARAFLKAEGIPYNDQIIDQSKTASAAFQELHESAVPILVSSNKLVIGFQLEAYRELARSLKKRPG
ncbi:glutaredoxin family protein [Duganella levis]|uniref:Glutaredoxin domain-containing protein n=1 Tax=Duganella levis TaxID=2692169 RepID=A0ABW9VXV9_9BURK|nr:glutaredoxin family protein [Duganella levis]MYN26478.1 hypothetical protein [Duganella levis]